MDHKMLIRYRFIFPGLVMCIYIYILLYQKFPAENLLENFGVMAGAILWSWVYCVLKIRNIVWTPIKRFVIDAYVQDLLDSIASDRYRKVRRGFNIYKMFLRNKRLKSQSTNESIKSSIDFLFELVDSDAQLTKKSLFIMQNGLLVTCEIDAIINGLFALITGFVLSSTRYVEFGNHIYGLGILIIMFCFMLCYSVKSHLEKIEDQFDIINRRMSERVKNEYKSRVK